MISDLCKNPYYPAANKDCADHCNKEDKTQSGGTCSKKTHRCDCKNELYNVCRDNTENGNSECYTTCVDSGKIFGGSCVNHVCECYGKMKQIFISNIVH